MHILHHSIGRCRAAALSVAAAAFTLAGCARAKVTTEVKDNGAWFRVVELKVPASDKTGLMKDAPKIEDSFVIPGAPWTVTRATKGEELVVTCKRSMQPGETLKRDIVCVAKDGDKKREVAVNECSVKESSPGVFTYRETIHWLGPPPKLAVDPDTVKVLKAVLPATVATPASMQHLSAVLVRELMLAMFGPPDPMLSSLFSQLMMNPDFAERTIAARVGDGFDKAIAAEYGDKLTAAQRSEVVSKLIEAAAKMTSDKSSLDPTKGMPNSDQGTMTALTVAVRFPGKIINSNGLIDKLKNEVYWGLYPEAASIGQDIVLTASCQVK